MAQDSPAGRMIRLRPKRKTQCAHGLASLQTTLHPERGLRCGGALKRPYGGGADHIPRGKRVRSRVCWPISCVASLDLQDMRRRYHRSHVPDNQPCACGRSRLRPRRVDRSPGFRTRQTRTHFSVFLGGDCRHWTGSRPSVDILTKAPVLSLASSRVPAGWDRPVRHRVRRGTAMARAVWSWGLSICRLADSLDSSASRDFGWPAPAEVRDRLFISDQGVRGTHTLIPGVIITMRTTQKKGDRLFTSQRRAAVVCHRRREPRDSLRLRRRRQPDFGHRRQ